LRNGEVSMGFRKPYERPVLQTYGDIRAITGTILPGKKLGSPDGLFLFQNGDPAPTESIS